VKEQFSTISSLTPVLAGRKAELEEELARLPHGTGSPLARVTGTHFARWVVVPYLQDRRGEPLDDTSYLLFTSWFDGPAEAYLDVLMERMRSEADAIWAYCVGYPGTGSAADFRAYLLAHRIEPSYPFVAYPGVTVGHILACLELRDQLAAFAVVAQGSEPAQLRRSWAETFHQRGD
jgi:hypothetical protein